MGINVPKYFLIKIILFFYSSANISMSSRGHTLHSEVWGNFSIVSDTIFCASQHRAPTRVPNYTMVRLYRHRAVQVHCNCNLYELHAFLNEKFGRKEYLYGITCQTFSPSRENLQNYMLNFSCFIQTYIKTESRMESADPNDSDHEKITYLDLSGKGIDPPRNGFRNMQSLQDMKLSRNSIKRLSPCSFRGLESLRNLSLDFNSIQQLPEGVFRGLVSVQNLNLQGNELQNLSSAIFSNLSSLMNLNLSTNKLKILSNVFTNNRELVVLDLSNNNDLVLEDNAFEDLIKLRTLYMNSCGITSLSRVLFRNMSSLTDLHISMNHLQEITAELLGTLTNLQSLRVAFNAISSLKGEPFAHNKKLTVLDLAGNNLTEIKESDFEGLTSLRVLNIASNSIAKVYQKSFARMTLLEIVVMSNNKIRHAPTFENNAVLKIIDISHNRLSEIRDVGLRNLPNLVEFWVTNNAIESISIPIFKSQNISAAEIHLEWNEVKRITLNPEYNEGADTMQFRVFLHGNPLKCDCHTYDLYRHLKYDRLPFVEFINGLICQHPPRLINKDLRSLNGDAFTCRIRDSCPEDCDCEYRASDGSRIVNCTSRGYGNLPAQAPFGTRILYIDRNNLKSLARLNESMWKNLIEIHADGNKIECEEFFIPKNLKYLGLKDNSLVALPESVKKHAERNKDFKVALSNNLWKCDCRLETFLLAHGNMVDDVNNLACVFPNMTIYTFTLGNVKHADLCHNSYKCYYLVELILLAIIILIIYYIYKLCRDSALKSRCPQYCKLFSRVKPVNKKKLFDCFMSCNLEDKEAQMAIFEELGKKPPFYTFYMHERNREVGKHVTSSSNFPMHYCRMALMILSEGFTKSGFHAELQEALRQIHEDKKFKLVVVLAGEFPDKDMLHSYEQYFLSIGVCLQFGVKGFWENLRNAFLSEDASLNLKIPVSEKASKLP